MSADEFGPRDEAAAAEAEQETVDADASEAVEAAAWRLFDGHLAILSMPWPWNRSWIVGGSLFTEHRLCPGCFCIEAEGHVRWCSWLISARACEIAD